jgi:uncharacterized repeat protein (TIGR01451 family)
MTYHFNRVPKADRRDTMITHTRASKLVLGLLALTPLLVALPAHAVNTAAGLSIANRATVNYSVGAVAQPAIGSSPTGNSSGAGTDTTFVVDNKIDLNLIETNTAPANTAPALTTTGTLNAVAVYKLTNTGNNPQGYTLAVTQPAGGSLFAHTDTFDMTNVRTAISSAACTTATTTTPTYNAGPDVIATSVATLNADSCVYVIVLGDTPNGLANGAAAIVRLTATTVTATTLAAIAETTTADTAGVDIVFADSAVGVHVAQVARDAKAFDDDEYFVVAPALTVTKTSAIVSDPFNLVTNPKAIPGAIIEYTITVANSASGAAAAAVVIADVLPANTSFVLGSITLNAAAVTDATGYTAGTRTVSVTAGALAVSATATLKFRVTID